MTGAGLTGAMRPPTLRPVMLILLLALAGPAFGAPADGDKPKPRRKPPAAKPAEDVGLRPVLGALPPAVIAALPPPAQPGGGFMSRDMASGGLAAGGLRSSLPALGDQGGQCRAACSNRRITCDAQDATPDCAPRWAICIARCNR